MLTDGEKQILEMIARGMNATQIGACLGYSPATIGNRLHAIREKLGVHTRIAAVAVALTQGWIEGPEWTGEVS